TPDKVLLAVTTPSRRDSLAGLVTGGKPAQHAPQCAIRPIALRMTDASRYAPLFSPLRIGPVVAPNRFFQVAHCNGMGHRMPQALARLREIKAEGGWGVVCTEEVEIHPSGDLSPCFEGRLWDEHEIPGLA